MRADKRNALDRRMFQSIIDAGEQIAADRIGARVVLSGDGKAFCAGLDTSLFAAMAERDPAADGTRIEHLGARSAWKRCRRCGCGSTWRHR